ncbi:hypothetical protein NIES2104_02420 [Leptolyngbya sp. NIES-2104]|nr:hypothetical protein NIES2104_02420 [Leptolyngbya sp. NIES-2104]
MDFRRLARNSISGREAATNDNLSNILLALLEIRETPIRSQQLIESANVLRSR